jgi:hypothetical protein
MAVFKDYPTNSIAAFATSGGNVGIGTNNPQERLEVVGNIRIDDTSGNPGFKISYDNTSKTLNFTFVGS